MIDNILFWNIRSVHTQNAFGRLIDLHRQHHYLFIALMEPFRDRRDLDQYKRQLSFDNAMVNCSGKIWVFWHNNWEYNVILDSIQHITIQFSMGATLSLLPLYMLGV